MIDKLIFASSAFQLITFVSLGLSAVYESKIAGAISLISLALGLLMNKLMFDEFGNSTETPSIKESDSLEYGVEDPYLSDLTKGPATEQSENYK